MSATPGPVGGWDTVVRAERVGSTSYELEGLRDFAAATHEVYRSVRGRVDARRRDDLCPMFGVIWGAARALAARLDAEGTALRGQRVLELGCGLALPSLVAARHGASVVATELHEASREFLERNARRNSIIGVSWCGLDWREPALSGLTPGSFPRVVASDVLFAPELPELVASMFARFLAPGGVGMLGDPGRPNLQGFVEEAEALGLAPDVHVDRVSGDGGSEDVFVVVLRR